MAATDLNLLQMQRSLEELFTHQADDQRLRDHIEGLRRQRIFPGLTWFWGPRLYERNRAMFRSLILDHFSEWSVSPKNKWTRIPWSDHAGELEGWLTAAREARDVTLVRRLLTWRYAGRGWDIDHNIWNAEMLAAYRAAPSAAARAIVLNEFDTWFKLNEQTAVSLYETDPASKSFILRHVPGSYYGGEKRKPWSKLADIASRSGDDDLYFALYRKQTPVKTWQSDVVELAQAVEDPEKLNDELDRRHLEGHSLRLEESVAALLEARGRDVMPYVRRRLKDVLGGWYRTSPAVIHKLAARRGWWDLWAAAIRACGDSKVLNKAVSELLFADETLFTDGTTEADRVDRLRMLAGVSREWNFPGMGLVGVTSLDDKLAAALYQRYPELIHGPYKPNITPTWWQGYPRLLKAAQDAGDGDLVDLMASRYATHARYDYAWRQKEHDKIMETADELGRYYEAIRDNDPRGFARRAANVLTRIPAYAVFGFRQVLKTNHLARLLFVRSFDAYLDDPRAVQDLIEGSDIHVQQLAYRILAQNDDRARSLAVANLDILLGTLLRPLHRKTRLPAFDTLANAASADSVTAQRVLLRSREALRLPDKKYPKEELVGLIGKVLHARPDLRSPAEQPVVYGLQPVREAVA